MRVFVPDIQEFFAWLHSEGHRYAVLRRFFGFEKAWPFLPPGAEFDMLADDTVLPLIKARYGRYKKNQGEEFDIYSVTGAYKGDEVGCPYFPEALSEEILSGRLLWNDLFCVPAPQAHLLSLLYHICYRKAESSGIGIDDPALFAASRYADEISALKSTLGLSFPDTLMSYHQFLQDSDIVIDDATFNAYVQKQYANDVKSLFMARALAGMKKGEMNLFVIRGAAVKKGVHNDLIRLIRENYEILAVKDIPFFTRLTKSGKMRGGKWRRGGRPAIAVVVFDPDPRPPTDADRQGHLHVLNSRQFLKRIWREWFTVKTGLKASANPLHSTDNEAEALGHLPLFFSPHEEEDILYRLFLRRRGM